MICNDPDESNVKEKPPQVVHILKNSVIEDKEQGASSLDEQE